MSRIMTGALFFATLGSGLLGGYIIAFSDVVNGLELVPDTTGIAAMQAMIDVVMGNALFFLAFLGTPVLSIILALFALSSIRRPGSWALLLGGLLVIVGVFGVTVGIHVPLNEALAQLDPASIAGSNFWRTFLERWILWNHVRAFSGVGATAAFIWALAASARHGAAWLQKGAA